MRLVRRLVLSVPPIPCIVHASVFDAFGWCASDELVWVNRDHEGPGELTLPTSDNPPGLGFVLEKPEIDFLPTELAALHLSGVALEEGARMLAPWAIDDATDLLYETRTTPKRAFYLATTSLAALYWGLHDWAHFHAHGPFEERAATELQCDATALTWLELNRDRLGLGREALDGLRRTVIDLSHERFASEGKPWDPKLLEVLPHERT